MQAGDDMHRANEGNKEKLPDTKKLLNELKEITEAKKDQPVSTLSSANQEGPLVFPLSLRDRVFNDICKIKQEMGMPTTSAQVLSILEHSQDFQFFCYLLGIVPSVLIVIFQMHQASMVGLRMNKTAEEILTAILSSHHACVMQFANQHALPLPEFIDYLNKTYGLPYWKLRFLKSPMNQILQHLRGIVMEGYWEISVQKQFGTSIDELSKLSYQVFGLPLIHAIDAVKKISDEGFINLCIIYSDPVEKIDIQSKVNLIETLKHYFFTGNGVRFQGAFFTTYPRKLPQPRVIPTHTEWRFENNSP